MGRRSFLRQAAAAGAAVLIGACRSSSEAQVPAQAATTAASEAGKTPVAIVRHSGILADPLTPKTEAVLACLDEGIKHAFSEGDAARAWARVCTPEDVVALKINCISGLMYSHPVVVGAIVQRLQDIGVPAQNIIVWDRTSGEMARCGYEISREGGGVRYYGTDGAYDEWVQHRAVSTRLSKIISQTAQVLINVPVLKDHGGAGVTLAMKNHYGSVANPGDLHGDWCNQAAELSDVPRIRSMTRLIIADCTRALFDGGPGGRPDTVWQPEALLISTNPVATDAIGLEMMDAKRAEEGREPLRPRAKHVATAAEIGLGPNNRAEMSVLETAVG